MFYILLFRGEQIIDEYHDVLEDYPLKSMLLTPQVRARVEKRQDECVFWLNQARDRQIIV